MRLRTISNIIAVLGLLTITSIAVIIGYTIITNYVFRTLKPTYEISVAYVKLVFITDNEIINGETYSAFKVEVGISNPGKPTSLKICVISAHQAGSEYEPVMFTGFSACPTIVADPGYNVYSAVIRISNDELSEVGCGTDIVSCPIKLSWHIAILKNNKPISIEKPVYVVP